MAGGCKPRLSGCALTCGHRQIVADYWCERERLERQAEDDYRERDHPDVPAMLDFRAYLLGRAGLRANPL